MVLKKAKHLLCALSLSTLALGCAKERDPINRVQPNALSKSFFVGENLQDDADNPSFHYITSVVDVGYGATQSGVFTGSAQQLATIRWDVQEDLLIGRLAYERIDDTDGKGVGATTNDGQVVVAYRISKHFDIRRGYNPSTGEELNVVEENALDRPWFERDYMRVDWSENLVVDAYDFDVLSWMGLTGGVEFTPLSYYVNDPTSPDAPYFDVGTGYFDVTNKLFAKPANIDLSHLGGGGLDSIPACLLSNDILGGDAPSGNCNPVEITVRQSFKRVVDTDYEPVEQSGYDFEAFGAFHAERSGYARNFGMSDDKWHRFTTRYNIWARSHYYDDPETMSGEEACYTPETIAYGEDPKADDNGDGTSDRCWKVTANLARQAGACEGLSDEDCYFAQNPNYGGSQCDEFSQKCTLPYRARTQKTVTWYYTNGSSPEYYDGSEWATHDHDVAMRHAVQSARYAECMSTNVQVQNLTERKQRCALGDEADPHANANPVYFGQMDDHLEAKQLAKEVDDCRHAITYVGEYDSATQAVRPNYGAANSDERNNACLDLASAEYDKRSSAGALIDPGVWSLARMPEAIVLCHSPVELNDPAACAPAGRRLPAGVTAASCIDARENRDQELVTTCRQALNARNGDLRYHWVNVITAPQNAGPWGYGPTWSDPLTGEAVAASINVYSFRTDVFAQNVIDYARYISGELSAEDVTEAEYIKDWSEASEAASGNGVMPKLSRETMQARVAGAAGIEVEELEQANVDYKKLGINERIAKVAETLSYRASNDAPSSTRATYEARRERMKGTDTEAELVTKMMQQYTGTTELPTGAALEEASLFRGFNPTFQKELRNLMQNRMADRGQCLYDEAPSPVALAGLTKILERKFEGVCAETNADNACIGTWGKFGTALDCDGSECANVTYDSRNKAHAGFAAKRAEAMRKYVAQRAHYAVIVHEMGHTMSERHNFVSSADAYNYRPQYWQLRTNDGANVASCGGSYDASGECVGPRYFDPLNDHERDNLIQMWQHSSVMDYAGELTQDFLGLGAYDFAAVREFYGGTYAVYSDPQMSNVGVGLKLGLKFGGLVGIRSFNADASDLIHYSGLQKAYNLISDCRAVDASAFRPASWNDATQGIWDPVIDGLIVPNQSGQYTKCRQHQVDYVPSAKVPVANFLGQVVPWVRGKGVDTRGRTRVPYGFATDSWAGGGNVSVSRHDNGADPYEIFNFLTTQQELYHVFHNYRRHRQGFSVKSAARRTLGRYNTKLRDGAKGIGLFLNIGRNLEAPAGSSSSSVAEIAAQFPANLLAATLAFDHFAAQLARPEAGGHAIDPVTGVVRSLNDGTANLPSSASVLIPNGGTGFFGNVTFGGKLVENKLSEDHGEFDRDYTLNAGSYYDKIMMGYLLTESADNFISASRGDFVDARERAVSLADVFPDGFRRLVGNMLTGDDEVRGLRLAANTNGAVDVDADLFPSQPIGLTQWWGREVKTCFPAPGTTMCGYVHEQGTSGFPQGTINNTLALEPQVGWEAQKFLIAQTLMYLPENNQQDWLNMLHLWRLGHDSDPGFENRIEYHSATGQTFIARTFGTEIIRGKRVQKGISARILGYANELLSQAYVTTPVDHDGDSVIDWYEPVFVDGEPQILGGGTCSENRHCATLRLYDSMPVYLWQAIMDFGYATPEKKGVFE